MHGRTSRLQFNISMHNLKGNRNQPIDLSAMVTCSLREVVAGRYALTITPGGKWLQIKCGP